MKMVMGRNLWGKAVWGWRQYNLPWIVRPILRYRRYMLEIFLAAGVFQALGVVLPLVTQVIIDKVIVNQILPNFLFCASSIHYARKAYYSSSSVRG